MREPESGRITGGCIAWLTPGWRAASELSPRLTTNSRFPAAGMQSRRDDGRPGRDALDDDGGARPSGPASCSTSRGCSRPSAAEVATSAWDNRKQDCRRMFGVMIDSLPGFHHSRSAKCLLTRIQIPVETREIAAGDVDPDAMPGFEDIARRPQINRVFVNRARLDRLGLFRGVTKARAKGSAGWRR
jgi:hypothetical protein